MIDRIETDNYYYDTSRWPKKAYVNLVKYQLNNKFFLPLKLNIEVTTLCNLRCEFCVLKDNNLLTKRKKKIMTFNDFKNIINQISFFTTHIEFTGGEPLINKDIFKMIQICNENYIKTTLATNGILFNQDKIEELLENPPSILLIAFESGDINAYKAHRVNGELIKLLENIKLIINEKKQRKIRFPKIYLQTVVSRKTLPYINNFWILAKSLQVDVACTKPIFIWPDGGDEYRNQMIEQYIPFDTEYSYYSLNGKGDVEKTSIEGYCPNVQNIHIGADGSIYPCWYNLLDSPTMGNVNSKHLIDIWFSDTYYKFRQKMINHKAFNHECKYCIGIYKPELFKIKKFEINYDK